MAELYLDQDGNIAEDLRKMFAGIETSLPDLLGMYDFFIEDYENTDVAELAEWYMREVDNASVCVIWAMRAISEVCAYIVWQEEIAKHAQPPKPVQLSLFGGE